MDNSVDKSKEVDQQNNSQEIALDRSGASIDASHNDGEDIKHFYDYIIDKRIEFGMGQKKCMTIMIMCWILDAAELMVIGFLKPIMINEWGIGPFEQAMLGSTVFIGWSTGNFISGLLADTYGRRSLLMLNLYGPTIFGILSSFSQNIYQFLIARILVGLFIGIGGPSIPTLCNEINPTQVRARVFVFVSAMFPAGEIIVIFIAYIQLDTLESGNWHALVFYAALVGILGIILGHLYLIESPRFLLIKKKSDEAFEILDYLCEQADREKLSPDEKEKLQLWSETQQDKVGSEEKTSYSQIFQPKIIGTTIKVALMWVSLCFVFYGMMFELPTIFNEIQINSEEGLTKDEIFIQIFWQAFWEFPGGLFACWIIETKYGRQWSISIGNIIECVACIGILVWEATYFIQFITIIKFVVSGVFLIVIQYSAEIYPTKFRGAGLSFQNIVCRSGGIIMPFTNSYFMNAYGIFALFYVCATVTAVSAIAALSLDHDTKGQFLDDYFEEQDEGYDSVIQNGDDEEDGGNKSKEIEEQPKEQVKTDEQAQKQQ